MEQFLNNRKYLLIFVLFIALLLILVIYFILSSRPATTTRTETQIQPTVTQVPQITTAPNIATTAPTVAPPAPFTGAVDIKFTETEANAIDQERTLRRTSPYNGTTFTVAYNPSDDIFEVALTQPKENSQNDFEVWRKNNVPNVSLDRFIFK